MLFDSTLPKTLVARTSYTPASCSFTIVKVIQYDSDRLESLKIFNRASAETSWPFLYLK